MALNRNKNLKLCYSIREVAEMFDVNESTLRYWEKEFPQVRPDVDGRGVRMYKEKEIEYLRQVHNMVKVRGFKLAAAKKMLNANPHGIEKSTEVLSRLQSVKEELMLLKRHLASLT